ncbi:leucine-rich PPR motif-containing protein, mitochondrial [Nephila pilipes]|uniref:Leucine-rich PPR motif-containing protein, mitochondrial n=1 Tax=Nephila pilipes TaxID=299642 RepID=A0A8X6PH99_NEPPI|nr:leucine-rich PPR motif-containing protein, mitochondrial [Nephila pilipes]
MVPCCISRQKKECFTAVALTHKYNNYAFKENTELGEKSNSVDVDNVLRELDFNVQRTGRCSRISVENVLSMVEKLGFASETHGLYLLRCCGLMRYEKPDERVKMADEVWKKLQKLGVQINVRHLNSYLKVLVDSKHEFSISEFLTTMENFNIEPNKVTYMLFLQKYCNQGNLNGASEILQCLKENKFPVNESVFNLLINGHIKADDISGAQDMLEAMRSSGLSPTAESYTALACGYAEKSDIDNLKSLLENAKNSHITFSNKNYLQILAALSTESTEFVDELIGMMENINAWRQEVINTSFDLIFRHMEDVAFKLMLTVANSENNATNVFVKQLVKCDTPAEKIVKYCEEISNKGLNKYVFLNAAKIATELNKIDLAFALFEVLQKKGIPVRTYNFHPLLSSYKNMEEGIWLILTKMFQLGVPPDFFTYFDYVFPAVSVSNPETVISKIQETGHSMTSVTDSLFKYYCYHNQFDKALFLCENYPVCIHPSFSFKKLISMYERNTHTHTKNSDAYYGVLNYVLQNRRLAGDDSEVSYGKNLAILVQSNPSLFETLYSILNKNFKYSKCSIDVCSNILQTEKPELLVYIKRMKNSENYSVNVKSASLSVFKEENEFKSLKEKGLSTHQYLLERLTIHLRDRKDIFRINQLIDEWNKLGIDYPHTLCAQLLTFYCETSNLEMAKKSYEFLKEKKAAFKLDTVKVIDYATLLLKFSRFDEALDIIENECKELLCFGGHELLLRSIKKLFTLAIETGNIDVVKKLQNILLPHANTFHASIFYEPLVKFHLYRKDFESALEEFEKCVRIYQVAPCVRMLFKKCIILENHRELENVIKLSSSITGWGKQATLCELTLAFLETGRSSEALKVMQNMRNKPDSGYLEGLCSQLYDQNRVKDLLMFVKLICAAEHVDCEKIVNNLIKLADGRNDFITALALYNSTKHLIQLSDDAKHFLCRLLLRNKQKVPFYFHDQTAVTDEIVPVNNEESNQSVSNTEQVVSEFLHFVKVEDAQEALEKLHKMKKGLVRSLKLNDMTQLINLLIDKKILNELSYNVAAMSFLIENTNEILKPLIEKYSTSGDIESLNQIGNLLPDFSLKNCYFYRFLSNAYIISEKYEDLLLELEKSLDKKNKMFSLLSFLELLKRTDLEERVINLAKRYLEQNFDFPVAVVWAHYLINENYEKANEFFKLHPIPADKVDMIILKAVREEENIKIGRSYISAINELNVRKRCKEKAYGVLVDVMVLRGMYDEATALIIEAQDKDINLEKHYRSTLITLRSALEREKKEVPFTISEELVTSG